MSRAALRAACAAALLAGAAPAYAQSSGGAGQPLPSTYGGQQGRADEAQPPPMPGNEARPPMEPAWSPPQAASPAVGPQPVDANRTPAVNEALRLADVDPGPIGEVSAALPPDQFVAFAGSSNLFEIASSQLALQRSEDPDIRQYAQMMVNDHQATLNGLRRVVSNVQGLNLNQVGGMEPQARQMLATLQEARGADFDRLYVFYQSMAHKMAIEAFQNFAWNGPDGDLRAFAVSATPLLRQHHAMAQNLNAGPLS